MGLRAAFKEFALYLKNTEQTRLQERAWRSVELAGGRLLSRRAEGLKQTQLAFEKLDPSRKGTLWLVFGADSESDLEFARGELPAGLALAVANGLRKQGPEAMDAFAAQLRELSAKSGGSYSRWGGLGSDEILEALQALRPEAEALSLEAVVATGAKPSASKSRRL